ncbi:MAG: hypothetical protein HOP08_00660 [Cyclobacteriaceae bacterium]|nr:hypothetical protein [Cyclobacteriaceae bacterium]
MRKESELPIIPILGVVFRVHLNEFEFRQVDKPDNRISFDHLIDNGDHTMLMFDTRTNNGFKGTWKEFMEQKEVKKVRLPSFINLDRVGLHEFIQRHGAMDFLSRTDRITIFKELQVPVSKAAAKELTKKTKR